MNVSEDKKVLAEAYGAMMMTAAWQDLERFSSEEMGLSVKRMDTKSASDLSLGEVCEERGIRKGILKIIKHAEQCKEGI